MVTAVRGQARHPVHGCYRVSCHGAETEGRSGTRTHITDHISAFNAIHPVLFDIKQCLAQREVLKHMFTYHRTR